MTDHEQPTEDKPKFEALAKTEKSSLAGDVLGFLKQNKKWWLLPMLISLLVVSALLILSGTVAAPFIYTLF